MTTVTPEALRAIDLVEQMGVALGAAKKVLAWPELSCAQRLACLVVVLDREGRPHTPEALAERVGVDAKELLAFCALKGGPLTTFKPKDGVASIEGSEALYYADVPA